MKRKIFQWVACLQIGTVLFTGCHPTQPYFIAERGDLRHYLETATQLEYPDVQAESLTEVTNAREPLSLTNPNFEPWDLTLEDCISFALANTKIVRSVQGANQQTGDVALAVLSSPSQQISTTYDPAITSSSASTQPSLIDGNGNRTLPRGAARAVQVGGVEDALSEFDAQFSAFSAYNTTDRPRNTGTGANQNIFTPPHFTARDSTTQFAISKRMATGTVATARAQTIYSQNNVTAPSLARAFPSDYTQTVELQIQQPLLRNRGTLVNRIPVVLARINEDIAITAFEERIRNLVKEVENAYWDLYSAYWAFETAKVGSESALQVWRLARERLVGPGQAYAEQQAKGQYFNFKVQVNAAFSGNNVPGFDPFGILGREQTLRFLCGLSTSDGRLIRPIDKPTIARVEFDWDEVRAEALTRSLELRQQKWTIKQRELELKSAKNQLLPDLNVTGLYRWVGVGDVWTRPEATGLDFPFGPDSAIANLRSGDNQEAAIRVELTPNPLGSRRAHALVTNIQMSLARENEILRVKEEALMSQLNVTIARIIAHYDTMENKLGEWNAAEEEFAFYQTRLDASSGAIEQIYDLLLRNQQRRAQAQQQYYRAVTEYNKSIVYLHLLKGSLLEYNNLALQEGPWPQKAYWDATERARERDAAHYLDYGASRPGIITQGPVAQDMGTANRQATVSGDYLQGSPTPADKSPSKNDNPSPVPGDAQPQQPSVPKSLVPQPEEIQALPQPDPKQRTQLYNAPIGTGVGSSVAVSNAKFNWNVDEANAVRPASSTRVSRESTATSATSPARATNTNGANRSTGDASVSRAAIDTNSAPRATTGQSRSPQINPYYDQSHANTSSLATDARSTDANSSAPVTTQWRSMR